MQNGTNVTFLTLCSTSIFEKLENVNICQGRSQDFFRGTHNSSNRFVCTLPHPPSPPVIENQFEEVITQPLQRALAVQT